MKPSLILALVAIFLTSFLVSRAQERRTIEISETDTVWLMPTRIVCRVMGSLPGDWEWSRKPINYLEDKRNPFNMTAIASLLKAERFTVDFNTPAVYKLNSTTISPSLFVTVSSETEFKRLNYVLNRQQDIDILVESVVHEAPPGRQTVRQRLIRKALAAAKNEAAASGSRLGTLINVEEPYQPGQTKSYTSGARVEAEREKVSSFMDWVLQVPSIRTMVFRFELK